MKRILFCRHAKLKLLILAEHNVFFTASQITEAIKNPDKISHGKKNRKIAQKIIDEQHVLRVIFEEEKEEITIITFYPARRERYEN